MYPYRIHPAAFSELFHSPQVPNPTFPTLDLTSVKDRSFDRSSSQRPFPSLAVSTLECSHLFTQFLSLLSQQWVLISLSGYELFMCSYNLPYATSSLTLFSHFLPLSLHIASFQVANMFTVKATLTQLCLKLLLHYFLSTTKFIFNFITISNIQKHGIPIYL